MYYELNGIGKRLYGEWENKYYEENNKLGGNSSNDEYIEGWSIIDNKDYIHTLDDLCGLYVFGYDNLALETIDKWICDYGKDDDVGYGIVGTLGDLRKALEKYYIIPDDNSSQIIEDIKWFMFDDCDRTKNVTNEFGFNHDLQFISWCKGERSFIVADADGEKYRINITKEVN